MNTSSSSNSSRNLLFPILLETLPLVIALIGLALKQFDIFTYSIVGILGIYILSGWYIFKTDKYRTKDIIFTELSIILFLSPVFIAFTYKILS